MQGTSLTKQERECKLYDAFDKFTHIKGESLHMYYLRFTQLINDMNIYNMKMEQFQVNTKFLNNLPPEWNLGFVVLVFSLRDDPIAYLNKAMVFLTVVASLRVTVQQVQQVQGRQGQNYFGTTYKGNATSSRGNTTSGQARVVKCYNCQGEGHMARQCTQPKRQRNVAWYNEKAMLVEAQEAGEILDEEQLAFLADPRIPAEQMINHVNNWEKANNEQNQESITAELERYKERVKTFEQCLNIDLSSREKMIDSQMDDMIKEKLALKEKKITELNNIVFKVGQSAQTVHMLTKPQSFYDNVHKQALGYQNPFYLKKARRMKPTLYDGIVISKKHVSMHVIDNEETLVLEEESRSNISKKAKDPKVIAKKISHKPIDYEKLNRLTYDFGKRFTPQQELSAIQAFWLRISNPTIESSLPPVRVKIPSELPKNNLKAQLKDKDTTICKLKDTIKSLRKNNKEEIVDHDRCDLATINTELENSVAKLLSENERLCKEINHVKQVFKYQFDSIKQTRVLQKEQCDPLINKLNLRYAEHEDLKGQIHDKVFVITSLKTDLRKLKGKATVDNVAQIPSATTVVLGMFKIDLEPLSPKLMHNRESHIFYLKHTQDQADIL
nr:hypothetical protein [Tanacetum cinerariifolium]